MSTTAANREHSPAPNFEEIKPLVELCRAGKLFAVQDWIKAGRPVNPPDPGKGNGPRSPLEVAIEIGFHSLIQVLLEAGASFGREGYSSAMSRALKQRRLDIVKLLVEHGYDPRSVDMREVFETWDGELMDYFIDRGADLEEGNPLAHALCNRIRTALRVLKRNCPRLPSLRRQADIALRHHCKEGNLKWVSLMLWAGADPYSAGSDDPETELSEDEEGYSALAFAALHRHYEVFKLKQVHLDVRHPSMRVVALWSCGREGKDLLRILLERGMPPNDQENGGCSLLQHALERMSWNFRSDPWSSRGSAQRLDTSEAGEQVEIIELLVQHGARWVPKDRGEINSARRSLLKLVPKYTLAFFSIMARNRACSRDAIQALVTTAAMKKHLGERTSLVAKFIASFPDGTQPGSV
jgi:hypothetical protein